MKILFRNLRPLFIYTYTRPMRRLFILILLLSLASAPLQAASYYYFDHFTTYEGLPSNTIH